MLYGLFGGNETRSLENPSYSLTDPTAFAQAFGFGVGSQAEELVSEVTALGVPAIWQAINVIAGTIAHLPIHLYKRQSDGSAIKADNDPLYTIVHDNVNRVLTSYQWRKWLITRMLIDGRSVSAIMRNKAGRVASFRPLDNRALTIAQSYRGGDVSRLYTYNPANSQQTIDNGVVATQNVENAAIRYQDTEILDFPLLLQPDGVSHYSPLFINRNSVGLIIAAERYAATLFSGGGVPPLALTGPAMSPQAAQRAHTDINSALRNRDKKRNILDIPSGFELKAIGIDPQKQQLIEVRRFQISEVSRIFNIPPSMLHDLTTGTYSNVEQQNLSFAQHTIAPLVELIEQEMNLKLFGARNSTNFVEFNLDAIKRGDLLSRMEALARAVNSALITPNEARSLDNRPAMLGGDRLMIQGATVPIDQAGQINTGTTIPGDAAQ